MPFPAYVDKMSSPFVETDVLSNRFGNGHGLPSALNEEVVVQLAESGRDESLHAEVRQEPAWLANISEEISSTPYYPLQPLTIWQHPAKGIGRYRSGYVKLPPGSYTERITGKGAGKVEEWTNENRQRAAVSRVNIIQLASNLTSAAASSAVDPEHSRAQAVNPPATSYNVPMQREGDGSTGAAVPRLDRIRLMVDLISAGG